MSAVAGPFAVGILATALALPINLWAAPETRAAAVGPFLASAVVFCVVYSLVHFPLAEVNTTFPLALVLGAAMRLTATGTIALRWKGRRTLAETG